MFILKAYFKRVIGIYFMLLKIYHVWDNIYNIEAITIINNIYNVEIYIYIYIYIYI